MGDHYVPQYYLKGFSFGVKEHLWSYDKLNDGKKFCSTIKKIANENKFYSPEVEQYLANTIEGPANLVLQKIHKRNQINDDEKKVLSEYMAVMYKRVPQCKQRLKERAPKICNDLLQEWNKQFDSWALDEPDKIAIIENRKNEMKEILEGYSKDPSKEVWLQLIPPEKTPRIVAAIRLMTWTFLTFDEKPAFLTCDNPIFYFLDIGVGKTDSEITFPISSHIVLWCTWRKNLPESYMTTNIQTVREINRRTASNATRYVYSGYDESWLSSFIAKGNWQLNKLI